MYLQIENEFKNNSKILASQLLFILWAVLFSYVCTTFLNAVEKKGYGENIYALVLFGGMFIFYVICYFFVFFKGLRKEQRTAKAFFQVSETIRAYQSKIHSDDIKILKEILEKHKINTRPKVEEAIRHYQCLLPRKVPQSGQLLSILAFVISALALLLTETVMQSVENMRFILGVIFTVILIYILVWLIEKKIFRIFWKDELYTRIEDSLSEIFMTYYLKKDSKTGEENNG